MALSIEMRRLVCIHEAAHAVVFSLGRATIYRLAVAPTGATTWTTEGRKGAALSDLWGVCCASDGPTNFLLKWNEDEWRYEADKAQFVQMFRQLGLPVVRQAIRAYICGVLAGPIAEALAENEDPDIWEGQGPGDDVSLALGYSQLLHWRHDYEYLVTQTETVLRRPDVWEAVIKLADALEVQGDMEEFPGLLPNTLSNWPPSPMAHRAVPLGPLRFDQ